MWTHVPALGPGSTALLFPLAAQPPLPQHLPHTSPLSVVVPDPEVLLAGVGRERVARLLGDPDVAAVLTPQGERLEKRGVAMSLGGVAVLARVDAVAA